MKIKKLYIAIVALALSAGMTSCNDYLDTLRLSFLME